VLSGASGVRNGNTQFLCSSGLCAVFLKSASRHVTSNLCFFYLVGSTGPKLYFGTSGASNVDTLFFML
jgi:hypothetical protein